VGSIGSSTSAAAGGLTTTISGKGFAVNASNARVFFESDQDEEESYEGQVCACNLIPMSAFMLASYRQPGTMTSSLF
jgi:hypothetical protein